MFPKIRTSSLHLASILAVVGLLTHGCNTKVSQCNKLIDGVKAHTNELKAAIEKLAEIQSAPTVADAFSKTIKAASDDITALEFSDEQVAGFKKQYIDLLAEAEKVTQTMSVAAKANDREALDRAAAEAERVGTLEESIVNSVNEYCQS